MKRVLPLSTALAVGLIASAQAAPATSKAHPKTFSQGTPVSLVGVITSQPRDAGVIVENKMQVGIGPERTDYTLHLSDARLYNFHGQEIGRDHFQDKMWVYAEGFVMDDPRRIDVKKLQVIGMGTNPPRSSRFFRQGHPNGYLVATGAPAPAVVKTYPQGTPVVIVGKISSPPKGLLNEKKMQVAVGPAREDYTLHFGDGRVIGFNDKPIDEDGLDSGQWVRAEGFVMDDPRRIDVKHLEVIAPKNANLQSTRYFRAGYPMGYVVATGAPAAAAAATFTEGTPVVVLGRISSPPKGAIEEKKMQVAVGPARTDYTLHFRDAQLIGLNGQKIDEDAFDDGQWVRATGTVMDDPRRINVSQIQVIAPENADIRQSAFFRPGLESGYVMATAGERQVFYPTTNVRFTESPVTIVGRVTEDVDELETRHPMRVMAAGNEWKLDIPDNAVVLDAKGERLSYHDVDEGQWVRATGYLTEAGRIRVTRMENIGRDELYRTSSFFRTGYPLGYVERGVTERVAGERLTTPVTITGTVFSVYPDLGYFTVRDSSGRTHKVLTRDAEIENRRGNNIGLNRLKVGDIVTVRGYVADVD